MVIITARSAFDGRKGFSAIRGAINRDIRQIDGVWIFGINNDLTEVPASGAYALIGSNQRPVVATIIGAEEPTFPGINQRIDPLPVGAARYRQAYASPIAFGQTSSGDM